jgi:hypothetical protein
MKVYVPLLVLALFLSCEGVLCAQPVPAGRITPSDQAYFSKEGGSIRLGNRLLELQFSSQNGELQALIHKKSGVDLKKEKTDCYHTIWGLSIFTTQKLRSWTDNARSAKFFRTDLAKVERTGQELKLQLVWDGICLDNGTDYPATVQATISIYDGSPFSTWRIAVQNRGQHAIEKIAYPLIAGIQELGPDGSDDCLVVPTLEGRLYHNPTRNLEGAGNTYPSCFLNMQFATYYDNNAGFYFACYDNQGYVKQFSYGKQGGRWATMQWEHYGEGIRYGADFVIPYPVTVGVFQGDWYTAADIYKRWATNQWWAKRTLDERKLPAWLMDCGVGSCFVTRGFFKNYNTSFKEISELAQDHRRYFGTGLLTELWGWENKGAWSWGDYFPPLEGWINFDNLVADFHANRCRLCTYIGSSALNGHTDFWKSQRPLPSAKRSESGRLLEGFGEAPLATVEMCPATAFWQEHLQQTAVELTKHKVDLIQFDCFSFPPTQTSCYAINHGHPLGVGKWTTDAWLGILGKTVAACRDVNPDVCFTSEGIAEIYIPHLDVAHYCRDVFSEVGVKERGLWNGTSEIIPLFHYMYHDCLLHEGQNYLGLLGYSEYNLLCIGRMLVWGEIPFDNTWIEINSPRYDKNALDMLKRIGQARTSYAKDFLVHGQMQRPLQFTCPSTTVPLGNALGNTNAAPYMQVPGIMHSAWRAPDGDHGFVFVNISKDPVPLKLSFDFRELGLRPEANPFLYCVRDGKYSMFKISSNSASNIDVIIQPVEIVLIGLCEADGPRAQQVLKQVLPESSGKVTIRL